MLCLSLLPATALGLADGVEITIIAAQYRSTQLVDVRTKSITGTDSVVTEDFDFTASKGDSYKVFLLSSTSVPLCEAKELSLG